MTGNYNPKAVRAVLIAFETSEKALKAHRAWSDLPDDLRVRIADEVMALVDQGVDDPQLIVKAVLHKFLPELRD